MVWVWLALLLIVPVTVIHFMSHLAAALDRAGPLWRRLRGRPEPQPIGIPLHKLAADLTRLSVQFVQLDESDAPAKAFRLRAVALAYDGALIDAARTLEVPAPGEPPLRPIDRLQTEAALAQQGLVW